MDFVNEDRKLHQALSTLYEETQDLLHVPFEIAQVNVEETFASDWTFTFYKNYVSKNKPLLIKNACTNFAAFGKWNMSYFRDMLSDKDVSVAITPNGYADGISKSLNTDDEPQYFALPEEKTMKMREFLNHLINPMENFICYIQRQNSNLNDFSELSADIGDGFEWASKAFGCRPDNINLWMGDSRAVTSILTSGALSKLESIESSAAADTKIQKKGKTD